jgi:MFS family permease
MKLNGLYLFYLSQILTSFYFWLAIAIPYLAYRGLTPAESFSLISIYNLLGVLFEYPTGMVGDRFGYRKMLLLANFLTFISMIILATDWGYGAYLLGIILLALGSGFLSGNDVGLLKALSKNIKKDTAVYHSNIDFILFLSSVLGGLISKLSFEYALYISAFLILAANIPMYFIATEGRDESNDSFRQIIRDSAKAFHSKKLIYLFIFSSVFGGFMFTIKSIFGSLGGYFNIDISLIGILVGMGGLLRSVSARIYAIKLTDKILLPVIVIPVLMLFVALIPKSFVVIAALLTFHFLFGFVSPKIDGDLHDLASNNIRASLFSLRRLIMRLVASLLLMFYGIFINAGAFGLMFTSLSIVFTVCILVCIKYLNNKFKDSIYELETDELQIKT